MEQIKVGDVVVLKSGGPTMTVVKVDSEVHCSWFLDYGSSTTGPHRAFFPMAAVKKVTE